MPKSPKRKPALQLAPRRSLSNPPKLRGLLEELQALLKKPLPLSKKSSVKDDPSKVVKAILRELPKFKLPSSGKKKPRR